MDFDLIFDRRIFFPSGALSAVSFFIEFHRTLAIDIKSSGDRKSPLALQKLQKNFAGTASARLHRKFRRDAAIFTAGPRGGKCKTALKRHGGEHCSPPGSVRPNFETNRLRNCSESQVIRRAQSALDPLGIIRRREDCTRISTVENGRALPKLFIGGS